MIVALWICLFIVVYTFVGYGIVLFVLIRIKRLFKPSKVFGLTADLRTVSLIIAAYNEADLIAAKIENSLALDYPKDKIQYIFVTDGSTDDTAKIIEQYKEITLLNENIRSGKMAAIKRAIPFVKGEIMVFSDANTFLNVEAIRELVKHYQNDQVGAVAG